MTHRIASFALIAGLLGSGCNMPQGPQDQENTAPPVNALNDPAHPGVEACAQGDLEAQLQIARDFEDSCHEMVVCGGLSMAFTISLIEVLIHAASGDPTEPSGFVYVGEGRYAAGTQMELTLRLGKDTSFGKAGDVIAFDVFQLANYFSQVTLEAKASVDTSGKTQTSLTIDYQGAGPGFELLGLQGEAEGKIEVDFATIAANLGANVVIETKILMTDERESSTVSYELYSQPTPAGEYFQSGPMSMELVKVSGSATTGQTILVKNWGMQYKNTSSSGTLDGSFDLDVRGGAFDYGAKFVYPHRKEPDVALSCL